MRRLVTLFLAALAATAAPVGPSAQTAVWESTFTDNGVWFEGWLVAPDRTLFLWCGGATPGGPGLPPTDEPNVTAPGTVALAISHPALQPPPGAMPGTVRSDLLLVTAGQGFGLPGAAWDELNGRGFIQPLAISDPFFAAIAAGGDLQVWAAGVPVAVHPAAGLATGFAEIAARCTSLWQTPAPPVHPVTNGLLTDATAAIVAGCGSNADLGSGYAQTGDIDGDGIPDLVIDWAAITCLAGPPRPFCGAANCSVQVYLSSRPDRRPFAETFAVGVQIEPGPDGRAQLLTGTTAGRCPETTRPAQCQNVIVWTGSDLRLLPPGGG